MRILLFLAFLLSACATTIPADSKGVASQVSVQYDPYTKSSTVVGALVQMPTFPDILSYRLRGVVVDGGKDGSTQLYVTYWSQSGWRFFNAANDIDGRQLQVTRIAQDIESGGAVQETVGVETSVEYLRNHRATGLDIKVSGQKGAVVVKVPPQYIDGFLMKMVETWKAASAKT
jgi:hypothetical protein